MKLLGTFSVEMQWHGTNHCFESFDQSHLKSLGFHFGDIEQAKYFAGSDGWLYKANLAFRSLLDIGNQDWGWTSLQHIVFAFFTSCVLSRVPVSQADIEFFLGAPPWSLAALTKTSALSADEQARLSSLFAANEIDGIRYVNKFEPPDHPGGVAYFVLRPDQIDVVERLRAEPLSSMLQATAGLRRGCNWNTLGPPCLSTIVRGEDRCLKRDSFRIKVRESYDCRYP